MSIDKIKILSEKLCASGIGYSRDCVLAADTSFRIGGPCDIAIRPDSEEKMISALSLLEDEKVPFITVGRSSNLLFDDKGFRGAVLFTSAMKDVSFDGNELTAESGCPLTLLAGMTADRGLSGLEFAYGIPGSVGGAVYMNAGAYGGQISDVFSKCRVYDTENRAVRVLNFDEMNFSYRQSALRENRKLIMLSASFSLTAGNTEEIKAKEADFLERRRSKQPLEYPSAGSVFKRPREDVFVGKMIEDAGLKGTTVGGAQVSEKHAGFIVNRGGATSADVHALIELVQRRLYEKYGIVPECEIISVPEIPSGN